MNREKEFAKNTIILAIGSFLPKLVSFITIPILTAYLSKEEYGYYDLLTTLVSLLIPMLTLQIQSAAFRFLIDCRDDKEETKKIITSLIFFIMLVISVAIVFFIIVSKLSGIERTLIALYFCIDIIYVVINQIVRGLSYNKIYSIGAIIVSFIDCICVVVTVFFFGKGLLGVLFSTCIAKSLAIMFESKITKINAYIDIKYLSIKRVKEMISYSWPMIPNNLSNWVLKLSDRFIITAVLGVEANAIYAVANKVPSLLLVGQSVMIAAWQENAAISLKDNDVEIYYSNMFDKISKLVWSITALIIGYTPILFKLLIKGDYDEAYIQMPILILGMFFACMSSFQGGIYIAHKRTVNVGITTIIAAMINLIVNLKLIDKIGIMAGSISTLVAYVFLYVYRIVDMRKFQKMHYNVKEQIILICVVVIMLIACAKRVFVVDIINMLVGTILGIIVNKDIILNIYRKVKY